MKRTSLLVALALLVGWALPTSALEPVDPGLLAGADKVLATMPNDYYQIALPAAQQLMENAKPVILDVREPAEIAKAGWIPGSTNIPIRDLAKKVAELPASKTAPILTYCKGGYRGGMAVLMLRMWGYTNVRAIMGGMDAWEKAGLKVEKK